jgi:RNA polymerase sigma factor for flagellar operon FliA
MSAASPSLTCPPDAAKADGSTQRELWRRYAKSGQGGATENELIEQYLPLVKTVVGRLAMTLPAHVNSDDLYSAGLVGLLNAVRRFNPKAGSSFESYARVRIRGAVLDELRRLDWVPRSVHDKAKKVEKAMQQLTQEGGSIPTDTEMARALNLSVDQYGELLDEIRPASYVCLDSVQGAAGENSGNTYDVIADDSQVDPQHGASIREMAGILEQKLQQLPEAQRKVLALYYFEDLRLREIAEAFGVTESRICQIHAQAILTIKALLQKMDPESFNLPSRTDS